VSDCVQAVRALVQAGNVRISDHGYDELADDGLSARDVMSGMAKAVLIEHYPDYPKGPCALFLLHDKMGHPVHALWGIPKGHKEPAVLVTAYRPDPQKWDATFCRRI
jgi:hypothetical protein